MAITKRTTKATREAIAMIRGNRVRLFSLPLEDEAMLKNKMLTPRHITDQPISGYHLDISITMPPPMKRKATYFVNTLNNIFGVRYLTTHILYDILPICHTKWKRRPFSFIASVVGTSGILTTPIRNQQLVLNAIAPTGRNHVLAGKESNKAKRNDF